MLKPLLSSLGCFVLALGVAATSLVWGLVANWPVLILGLPIGLAALAAYLNFGPKRKPSSPGEKVAAYSPTDEGQDSG